LNIEGVKLSLKAGSWTAQGLPDSEVLPLLVQATAIEPKLTEAQLRLALAYDLRGDFDLAIERYRAILAVESDNAVALNNLAYILAERKNDPKQALPLAEEAYVLTNQAAIVADTLGWIHHKLGNHGRALPYLERAARLSPLDVEVAFHAAVVHAELGNMAQARTFLASALKLDQRIAERNDVKALQAKIK
jgi:Tfp pilus assembly protein PilF